MLLNLVLSPLRAPLTDRPECGPGAGEVVEGKCRLFCPARVPAIFDCSMVPAPVLGSQPRIIPPTIVKKMPQTSIIIPTHNRAAMLRNAIVSAQTAGRDVEVIVVDDASTDATSAVCREFPDVNYLHQEKNVGLGRARNIGVANSSGEFLVFLDDDDLRLPGSVDKQADVLLRNEAAGFVYGQVLLADPTTCTPTGELRPKECPVGDIFWRLLGGNFIHVPSVMVRKRSFTAIGLFDPTLRGTEDWDAWIRLAADHPVDAVNEPVAIYRDFSSASGQMSSNRPKMCRSTAHTLAKALRSPRAMAGDGEKRERLWTDCIDGLWYNLIHEGSTALSTRRYRYAVMNFVTALQINPARGARAVTSRLRPPIFSAAKRG